MPLALTIFFAACVAILQLFLRLVRCKTAIV